MTLAAERREKAEIEKLEREETRKASIAEHDAAQHTKLYCQTFGEIYFYQLGLSQSWPEPYFMKGDPLSIGDVGMDFVRLGKVINYMDGSFYMDVSDLNDDYPGPWLKCLDHELITKTGAEWKREEDKRLFGK